MSDELPIFCCNIRYLRKKNGWTQKQMAEKLKISVGYVRKLERGQIPERMGIITVWDAHIVFGIPMDALLEKRLETEDARTGG